MGRGGGKCCSYRSVCKGADHDGRGTLPGHHGAGAHRLARGEGGGNAGAARGQVVRNRVLDHPQETLGTVRCPHTELVQQLDYDGEVSQYCIRYYITTFI